MTVMEQALAYLHDGFSVVPVGKIKKPFVEWTEFQSRLPTDAEVLSWWERWPDAGVAIITGKLSGITVPDFDLYKPHATPIPDLPESMEIPTAITPRHGKHLYFSYDERMPNKSNVGGNVGFDCRNDGGYVVAPPTKNGDGIYSWAIPLRRELLNPIPDSILALFNKDYSSLYKSDNLVNIEDHIKSQHLPTNANINFTEGSRDETLFHLANHLVKGRMSLADIEMYLRFFSEHCVPPFPQAEINAKIQSAIKRAKSVSVNVTQEITDWVMTTNGIFTTTLLYNSLHLTTREEKKTASVVLSRLNKDKVIESLKRNAGQYRLVDKDCEEIDYLSEVEDPIPIQFPLNLHELVEIMPGNIILIAGEPNAGKTAWLFNFVKLNMYKYHIHYFSSEMSKEELKKRLLKFDDIPLDKWRWKIYERSENFGDVIKPGRGNINIIDYLEIYKDFFEAGGHINDIYRKLNGALAIIAMQKNPGVKHAIGGFRTLEKPRLALAISPGRIDIAKAKNWATPENPNDKYCEFKILQGAHMYPTTSWLRDIKK
jgi:hypothetical protein